MSHSEPSNASTAGNIVPWHRFAARFTHPLRYTNQRNREIHFRVAQTGQQRTWILTAVYTDFIATLNNVSLCHAREQEIACMHAC